MSFQTHFGTASKDGKDVISYDSKKTVRFNNFLGLISIGKYDASVASKEEK